MAIAYPLNLPAGNFITEFIMRRVTAVGMSESPFTFEQQVFAHQGQLWRAEVALKPIRRADGAAAWRAFFGALNGRQGTFLMGHPVETAPLGTWAGAPKVLGAHTAGVMTVAMDGFTPGATVKGGDQFQTGSGGASHLHEVALDAVADGAGLLTLEVWPRTRVALADNDVLTISNPKGQWRLAENETEWSYTIGKIYRGMRFSCMEAL
jgi:hypothetical protein